MGIEKSPGAPDDGLPGLPEDVAVQAGLAGTVRQLREELRQRSSRQEAQDKALVTFASTAAHDLRSPLAVVGAYAGLLEKNYGHALDERGLGYLRTIGRNVKRMGALINDLHDFARWGLKPLEVTSVDMDALVGEAVRDQLESQAKAQAMTPGRAAPRVTIGKLPPVHADAALLRQAVLHLLSNAFKFTTRQDGPTVDITGHLDGDAAVYMVRDNGAGFDMRYASRLFEPFQRLHGDAYEGTGLGLALVRQIVGRHGGRVWAEACEGQGAAFSFSLPCQAGDVAA